MMPYRLGIYEKAMPAGIGLPAALEAAKRAGFDFLELSVDESDMRLERLDWTADERRRAVEAMWGAELPVRTMCLSAHRKYPLGSRDPAVRARALDILEKAVRLALDLGIRVIQLAGYDVYYEEGSGDTRAWFLENLETCARIAAAHGVTLGFETMETPFMDTVSKAMDAVRAIDSPYLGVYPDLGNLTNACELYGLDVPGELRAARRHFLAMHVKETVPGVYRDLRFGEGRVDFASGIREARAQGVGLFVAECWHDGRADWRGGLRDISDFVRARFV